MTPLEITVPISTVSDVRRKVAAFYELFQVAPRLSVRPPSGVGYLVLTSGDDYWGEAQVKSIGRSRLVLLTDESDSLRPEDNVGMRLTLHSR